MKKVTTGNTEARIITSNSWKVNSLLTPWRLVEDWRHGPTHSRSRWRCAISTTSWPLLPGQ